MKTLRGLARVYHDRPRIDPLRAQDSDHAIQMQRLHMRIGHDRNWPPRERRQQHTCLRHHIRADMDVVAARAEADCDPLAHGTSQAPRCFSAERMRSTVIECGPSSLSMAISASA